MASSDGSGPGKNKNSETGKMDRIEKMDSKISEKIFNLFQNKFTLLIIILIGIGLRIIAFSRTTIWYDGSYYHDEGLGILTYGTFVTASNQLEAFAASLTYPPFLTLFYYVFDYNLFSTQLGSMTAGILAVIVTYLTTSSIFGKNKGLIAAAIIAFGPWVIFGTASNLVENFLVIFLSLTLWSIVKAFENDKYLVPAGVFAVLTYYTKTNIGLLLLFAALAFFVLWWSYAHRKKSILNPYLVIFIIIVIIGSMVRHYYIVQMSYRFLELSDKPLFIFTKPGIIQFSFQLPFHLLLAGTYFLFFIPETAKAVSDWRNKRTNIFILTTLGGIGLIMLHATMRQTWLSTLPGASERYFVMFIVPTIWIFLGYLDLDSNKRPYVDGKKGGFIHRLIKIGHSLTRRRKLSFLVTLMLSMFIFLMVDLWWGVLIFFGAFGFLMMENVKGRVVLFLCAFLIAGAGMSFDYSNTMQMKDALDGMHNYLEDGDIIAVDGNNSGVNPRAVQLYLADIDVEIIEYDPELDNADYIISTMNDTYENYTLIEVYNDTTSLPLRALIYQKIRQVVFDSGYEWSRNPPINVWMRDQ